MSLFTLYGVVALSGIAVNAAIVLISAANTRLEQGMRPVACDGICRPETGCACFYHLVDDYCGIVFTGRRTGR